MGSLDLLPFGGVMHGKAGLLPKHEAPLVTLIRAVQPIAGIINKHEVVLNGGTGSRELVQHFLCVVGQHNNAPAGAGSIEHGRCQAQHGL